MYELAFHITPDIEATDVATKIVDVQSIITAGGGSVSSSREARRIHLSYPIARKHYAYFSVLDMDAPADSIATIEAQLRLLPTILRFMTTKKPAVKELKALSIQKVVRAKPTMGARPAAEAPKKPATATEQKQIETELEKVLESI